MAIVKTLELTLSTGTRAVCRIDDQAYRDADAEEIARRIACMQHTAAALLIESGHADDTLQNG